MHCGQSRLQHNQAGKSRPMSNVIIWNPHYIIRFHDGQKTPGLTEGKYNALLERAGDIGANDMFDPMPVATTVPQPTSSYNARCMKTL